MRKTAKTRLDTAIVNVWQREVGQLSTRNFAHRFAASEDFVLRLDLFRKLEKHRGCVNTVSFSEDGDILVSGSDDRRVIFWEWETGHVKLSFHSGHYDNVFQAKIMPYTEDRTIVTCAADGQVRCAQVLERGEVETKLLGKHEGRAHKLAIEPGSPHIFYTCGEDGLVQHFDLRTGAATKLFTCQSLVDSSFSIDLNAIAIDPRNPNLMAIAGLDEYTRLYDIRNYKWDGSTDFGQPTDYFCPPHLIGHEQVAITGLAFSDLSELLVSYSDEFIYLFTRKMGLGPNPPSASAGGDAGEMGPEKKSASPPSDVDVKVGPQVYKGHKNFKTVKGVNFFGPKCEFVVSGSDCGRIFIWKKKSGELIRVMEADEQVVNCIESHPHSTVLVSSGIEDNIKVWTPKALDRVSLPTNIEKRPNRLSFFTLAEFEGDDGESETESEFEFEYDDGDGNGASDDFSDDDNDNGVSDSSSSSDDSDASDDFSDDDNDNGVSDSSSSSDDSDASDGFGEHSDGFSCDGNDDSYHDDDDDEGCDKGSDNCNNGC